MRDDGAADGGSVMVAIAVVLCVVAAVLGTIIIAASLNLDVSARVSVYAALLGVAVLTMAAAGFAMFVVLFPDAGRR